MDELKNLDQATIKLLHRHQILLPLIKNIFYEKNINDVELTSKEKKNIQDNFRKENELNSDEEYDEWIKTNNFKKDEFETNIYYNDKLKKLCIDKFFHKTESRFLKRKSELDIVVYSLIRLKDQFQAREIYLKLKEQEANFNDLAFQFSEGVEKVTKGLIGPIPLNKAHPKVIEVLSSIKPGEIYKPFTLDNWYIILRLESFESATLDDNMKLLMAKELLMEWVEEQSKSIMSKLLNNP